MRFFIAISAFFRALWDREYALRIGQAALESKAERKAASGEKEGAAVKPQGFSEAETGALQIISLFQKQGRLLDFLEEDLSAYQDAEIGASARQVHEGCRKALGEVISKEKIIAQEENSDFRVDADYDARSIRLSGRVSGKFPMKGTLIHPGWRALELRLPPMLDEGSEVLAQAEVEID